MGSECGSEGKRASRPAAFGLDVSAGNLLIVKMDASGAAVDVRVDDIRWANSVLPGTSATGTFGF
jgi:hypothetical protein